MVPHIGSGFLLYIPFQPVEEVLDTISGYDNRFGLLGREGYFESGIKVFRDGVDGSDACKAFPGNLVENSGVHLFLYAYKTVVSHVFVSIFRHYISVLLI